MSNVTDYTPPITTLFLIDFPPLPLLTKQNITLYHIYIQQNEGLGF